MEYVYTSDQRIDNLFLFIHCSFSQPFSWLKSNRYCRLKKQIKHDKNITEIQQQQQKFNNDDVNKIIILRRIYYWLKSVVGGRGKKRKSFKLSLLEIPKKEGGGKIYIFCKKRGSFYRKFIRCVFDTFYIIFYTQVKNRYKLSQEKREKEKVTPKWISQELMHKLPSGIN